ncbi:hypothetical protein MHU86_20662 [Fragilaria crotonensis]|nr:hypothetical protein MHU86_20662 [Fragilaria crotonensis]
MVAVTSLTSKQKKQCVTGETLFLIIRLLIRYSVVVAIVALLGVTMLMHSQSKEIPTKGEFEKVAKVNHRDLQLKAVAQAVSQTRKVDTPELLNAKQKSFLSKHCKLGSEKKWWIQDGDINSWRRRAPYFLLIGAKKCGTTSIFSYLQQHPNIVTGDTKGGGKELHSFQPDGGFPQWKNVTDIGKE